MGKSNVNKDHYIEPHGRERQGEEIVQKIHRQKMNENRKRVKKNHMPGEASVGQKKDQDSDSESNDDKT